MTLLEQLAEQLRQPGQPARCGRRCWRRPGQCSTTAIATGWRRERFTAAAEAYRLADLPVDELRARRRRGAGAALVGRPAVATSAIERADDDRGGARRRARAGAGGRLGGGDARRRRRPGAGRGGPAAGGAGPAGGGGRTGCAASRRSGRRCRWRCSSASCCCAPAGPSEAEPLLRSVLGGAADRRRRRCRGRPGCSRRALVETGREAEAEQLRQRYGLDRGGLSAPSHLVGAAPARVSCGLG